MVRLRITYIAFILLILCTAIFYFPFLVFAGEIKITGKAVNMPFFPTSYDKANFSMDITGPNSSGWFKYNLKQIRRDRKTIELNFESKSITKVSLSENQVTISGTGTLNGAGAYTFKATIVDSNPDKFAIIFYNQEGKIYLDVKLSNVVEGDFAITAT